MTIKNVIGALQSKGYSITYRKRKDGGVLITKIDGQTFKGAKGNLLARSLLGESLSTKQTEQLSKITKERTEIKELYKEYKRVATKWRKSNLPKSAGRMSFKRFRRLVKEEGKESALKYLSEKEKYSTGIAYSKNVDALASYIEELASRVDNYGEADSSDLYELAELVRNNDGMIRDENILPAYEELYRINTEALTDALIRDIVRNVKRILRI